MPMDAVRRLVTPLRNSPVTSHYPESGPLLQFATRGLPMVDQHRCNGEGSPASACIRSCPTGAILAAPPDAASKAPSIAAGRCIFCAECVSACPSSAIAMTWRSELSRTDRAQLVERPVEIDPGISASEGSNIADHLATTRADDERTRTQIIGRLGRSLHVRHLDAGSCNGCDWEIAALLNPYHDVQRLGIDFVASPRHADLLLVTGVMTRNLEEAANRTYQAMPEPRLVVAVGACAIGGGVFAGSPQTGDGATSRLPVDVFVPGCPPRPEAIIQGLLMAVHLRGSGIGDAAGSGGANAGSEAPAGPAKAPQ